MDYDDIDYDEGYSMKDIDDNWSNSDMDYETDSDSEMDNYNGNTNNWSNLTEDKINRQTGRHNNSLLDMINKKLESLETVERSITYTRTERKNDSFLDLYEKKNKCIYSLSKKLIITGGTITNHWYPCYRDHLFGKLHCGTTQTTPVRRLQQRG